MKKLINLSLVTVIMAIASAASAQVQVAVGLKAGLNFTNLNINESPAANYDARTGYHAGAYAMFKFTKFAIQPELIFSRQGQEVKINAQNFDANYDYINIPIILKFYVAGGFNLQAGPQFGFLSSAKGPVTNGQGQTTTQDLEAYVKSSDFSVGLGFGWDLPFGVNIGARYNLGLSDINKSDSSSGSTAPSAGTSEAKNQVIQVSVGYRLFKIGS